MGAFMEAAVYWLIVVAGLFLAAGSAISLSYHPHWFIRNFEFPRIQIASICIVCGVLYAAVYLEHGTLDYLYLFILAATVAHHLYHVYPYTRAASVQVQAARHNDGESRERNIRLVVSNVQMENNQYERWKRVIASADADAILAIEVDRRWLDQIKTLQRDYPHVVEQPQENYFGMMLLSRLELIDAEVRFVVEDEIPSIHTKIQLRSGELISLRCLHPRPPEPIRNQHATQRDAELLVVGRELEQEQRPNVVAGDLNDVAWSRTTRLFLKVSGMLDPRRGRGFFNTYNAKVPLFRFPLDHVFHSNDFRLVELRILPYVGSDHFPVLIELSFEPGAEREQDEPQADSDDRRLAQSRIETAECEEERPVQSKEK